MELIKGLDIRPGILAVIGSGGKTSLLRALAQKLEGRVILCTSTHIFPFEEYPLVTGESREELEKALEGSRVVCAGQPGPEGKLTAPALPFAVLARLADYVLVEADGSRHLPLKAHAPHEPVIPPGCGQVVLVAGASGLGQPVEKAVHRPEIFCALTGAQPGQPVTPALAGRAIAAEKLAPRVLLNQIDRPEDWAKAAEFARVLAAAGISVTAGSLQSGSVCLWPDFPQ